MYRTFFALCYFQSTIFYNVKFNLLHRHFMCRNVIFFFTGIGMERPTKGQDFQKKLLSLILKYNKKLLYYYDLFPKKET